MRRVVTMLLPLYLVMLIAACVSLHRDVVSVPWTSGKQFCHRKTLRFPSSPVLPDDEEETLQFVASDVVETWRERNYLVALGILSPDTSVRRRRRILQHTSCWIHDVVAKKSNNFTGEMLVLYLTDRSHRNGHTYTAELKEEALRWQDMVTLPINEGVPGRNKKIGDGGTRGIKAEVTMSRKVFLWYDLAVRLLPRVN